MREFELFKDYENARLVGVDEYQSSHPERTVCFDRLGEKDIDGIPVAVTRGRDGKLNITFIPDTHVLAIGATRSGKTTGYVLPTLNILPRKKNKPSMVISDPKQELYASTVAMLRENGYDIILLDFNEYRHSDCWNPLTKYFRMYRQYLRIEEEVQVVETDHGLRNLFRGRIFENQEELDRRIRAIQDSILADVDKGITSIAYSIVPRTEANDPFWDDSARDLLRAVFYGMLEDSENGRVTEKTFSFDTMLRICDGFSSSASCDGGYFTERSDDSKALQLAKKCVVEQADTTRKCIMSSFAAKVSKFRDTSVRRITCANTFEVSDLDKGKPKAIFLTYKDEESLHYEVISMFLTNLYTELIATARAKNSRLDRPFYFLLDEFGNLPRFNDFDKVISACGGRNIWFLLILQSYAQLNHVYKNETAEIIKDNLNTHLFFGTNNPQTKREFSEECGKKTIISPLSALNGEGEAIERYDKDTVALVPVSALNAIRPGECIVTQMTEDVLMSRIERSYLCEEFAPIPVPAEELYEDKFDFFDASYLYQPK